MFVIASGIRNIPGIFKLIYEIAVTKVQKNELLTTCAGCVSKRRE